MEGGALRRLVLTDSKATPQGRSATTSMWEGPRCRDRAAPALAPARAPAPSSRPRRKADSIRKAGTQAIEHSRISSWIPGFLISFFPFPKFLAPPFRQSACEHRSSIYHSLFTFSHARVVKWQTRTFEGRMPQGMGVQVPPRAPSPFSISDCGLPICSRFAPPAPARLPRRRPARGWVIIIAMEGEALRRLTPTGSPEVAPPWHPSQAPPRQCRRNPKLQ